MVHTVNAIVTAILALGAAAPILAAPVERRIDSGYSSVNSRAPILPPVTSSGVGPVGSGTPAPALYIISGLNLTRRAIDDELYVAARAPVGSAAEAPAAEAPAAPAAPAPGGKVEAIEPPFSPEAGPRWPNPAFTKDSFGSLNKIVQEDSAPSGNMADLLRGDDVFSLQTRAVL